MTGFKCTVLFLWILSFSSCYTKAKVYEVTPSRTMSAPIKSRGEVRSFRISGLPQVFIIMAPDRGFFGSDSDIYTQEELSKLRVYVKSLSGLVSVNAGAMTVHNGEEKEFDLRKGVVDRNPDASPIVGDIQKYIYSFSFFNISKDHPRPDCDIVLTIEDPTGLTRIRGLKLSGGFQDSL